MSREGWGRRGGGGGLALQRVATTALLCSCRQPRSVVPSDTKNAEVKLMVGCICGHVWRSQWQAAGPGEGAAGARAGCGRAWRVAGALG